MPDLLHLHPFDFPLQPLAALSPLQLSIAAFHPAHDSDRTPHLPLYIHQLFFRARELKRPYAGTVSLDFSLDDVGALDSSQLALVQFHPRAGEGPDGVVNEKERRYLLAHVENIWRKRRERDTAAGLVYRPPSITPPPSTAAVALPPTPPVAMPAVVPSTPPLPPATQPEILAPPPSPPTPPSAPHAHRYLTPSAEARPRRRWTQPDNKPLWPHFGPHRIHTLRLAGLFPVPTTFFPAMLFPLGVIRRREVPNAPPEVDLLYSSFDARTEAFQWLAGQQRFQAELAVEKPTRWVWGDLFEEVRELWEKNPSAAPKEELEKPKLVTAAQEAEAKASREAEIETERKRVAEEEETARVEAERVEAERARLLAKEQELRRVQLEAEERRKRQEAEEAERWRIQREDDKRRQEAEAGEVERRRVALVKVEPGSKAHALVDSERVHGGGERLQGGSYTGHFPSDLTPHQATTASSSRQAQASFIVLQAPSTVSPLPAGVVGTRPLSPSSTLLAFSSPALAGAAASMIPSSSYWRSDVVEGDPAWNWENVAAPPNGAQAIKGPDFLRDMDVLEGDSHNGYLSPGVATTGSLGDANMSPVGSAPRTPASTSINPSEPMPEPPTQPSSWSQHRQHPSQRHASYLSHPPHHKPLPITRTADPLPIRGASSTSTASPRFQRDNLHASLSHRSPSNSATHDAGTVPPPLLQRIGNMSSAGASSPSSDEQPKKRPANSEWNYNSGKGKKYAAAWKGETKKGAKPPLPGNGEGGGDKLLDRLDRLK